MAKPLDSKPKTVGSNPASLVLPDRIKRLMADKKIIRNLTSYEIREQLKFSDDVAISVLRKEGSITIKIQVI